MLSSVAVTGVDGTNEETADAVSGYVVFATAIGRRLGELHAILSAPTDNADFSPEKATAADAAAWAAGVRARLDAAVAVLGAPREWPDEESAAIAAAVVRDRPALDAGIDALAAAAPGSLKTRIHGDFHLGQVLVVPGDAYLIDFEGEPARPLPERRAKTSPLRDLAGVLRSFDYAAAIAAGHAERTVRPTPEHDAALENFATVASRAVLDAYRAAHAVSPRRWVAEDREQALLDLFLLEKAAYEVCYEAANRPTWLGVPLRGLAALTERAIARAQASRDG
jgi:maltose alpha-D-glucosyltransferase/alpha-amylase